MINELTLDSEIINNFTESLLKPRFDNPQPTPDFHKELWDFCCLPEPWVALAAPRGHAKSTSVTHAFTLALILFRERDFGMIISDTLDQACNFLADIAMEFRDNETLKDLFGFKRFLVDNSTEIQLEFEDGWVCCVLAKGSGQKVRGTKWRNKRPNFVICDDLENEEIVFNKETREKFSNWFYGSVIPMVSDDGIIRVVGTVLHMGSLLEGLLNDQEWRSKRFRAHNEDFSEILWPEKFSKEKLIRIRKIYINKGFPEGYAQEYLNHPIDEATAYFRKDDFLDIEDPSEELIYYAGMDFAISTSEKADFTAIVVAGMSPTGRLKVVDVRKGRWDSLQIIEEMFSVNDRYNPELFIVESGTIEKAVGPILNQDMLRRNKFINLYPSPTLKDKMARARGINARMRAGGVEFMKEASWYDDFEAELLMFPKATHDDQVDAFAHIGLTLDKHVEAPTPEEILEEEWEDEFGDEIFKMGINRTTGY
jgi:predicted phage terminase large subunit-like protein